MLKRELLHQGADLKSVVDEITRTQQHIATATVAMLTTAVEFLISKERRETIVNRLVDEWPLQFDDVLDEAINNASANYGIKTGISDLDLWHDMSPGSKVIDWIVSAIDQRPPQDISPTRDELMQLKTNRKEPGIPEIAWQPKTMRPPVSLGRHTLSALYEADMVIKKEHVRKQESDKADRSYASLLKSIDDATDEQHAEIQKSTATMGDIKDTLKQRAEHVRHALIRGEVAFDFVRGFEREMDAITNATFAHLRAAARLLLPRGRQGAVCERIAHEWPLRFPNRLRDMQQRIDNMTYVEIIDTQEFSVTTSWESHANPEHVIDWMVKRFEKHDEIQITPNVIEIDGLKQGATAEIALPDISWSSSPHRRWTMSGNEIAIIYLANKDIDVGSHRRAMAIDASQTHHDLLEGWRNLPKMPGETAVRQSIEEGTKIRLLAPGKSAQLDLPMAGIHGLHDATIHVLRKLQGWEGLRHWAAMQRLLSIEGERMGWVRWTMDGHMKALGYSKRSRESIEKQEATAKQIEMLTRIELEVFDKKGQRISQRPVLLVSERTKRVEGSKFVLEGITLQMNPLLYGGVRDHKTKKIGKNWLPAPIELAQIDHARNPYALSLGMTLPIRWRWCLGKKKRFIALSGKNLLEMAGIKLVEKNKHRAWNSLQRDLDKLQSIHALGRYKWRSLPWTQAGVCELYAPQWVVDRMIHKIKPIEKKQPKALITGTELKLWRKTQHLTQAQTADRLGVSISSIERSERAKDKSVVASIRKRVERDAELKKDIKDSVKNNTKSTPQKNKIEVLNKDQIIDIPTKINVDKTLLF